MSFPCKREPERSEDPRFPESTVITKTYSFPSVVIVMIYYTKNRSFFEPVPVSGCQTRIGFSGKEKAVLIISRVIYLSSLYIS